MTIPTSANENRGSVRPLLYLWTVFGVLALLLQATFRLSQISWEALNSGDMTTAQYLICATWVVANAYMEGYRGFQKKFVPRVLARAHHLATHPEATHWGLAPLFAMGYFKAKTRAKIAAWAVSMLVLAAIILVRRLPQPWRGIVDAGVVMGLSWGIIAMLHGVAARLRGQAPLGDPELCESLTARA